MGTRLKQAPIAAQSFPDRLIQFRVGKGYSQQLLADLSGISDLTIRLWEAGKHHPQRRKLQLVAEALDVNVEDFYAQL